MYGEKCLELIKEETRQTVELIMPYNRPLIEKVIHEMIDINKRLFRILEIESNAESANVRPNDSNQLLVKKVYLRAFLWNKRCLLAYHNSRLERLKRIRWEIGVLLPNELKTNLSRDELQWFLNYSKNLSEYMGEIEKGSDLTLKRYPPKQLYVQVRCLTEFGNLELEDGSNVVLSKDSLHFLPLSKCEKLIVQGIMEQIN